MQLRVLILSLLVTVSAASADMFDSARKKCHAISSEHRWIELTNDQDQSIAGFCEIDKIKDGPTVEPHVGTEVIKKEGWIKKGQMHGEWKRYYANGKPKDEGNWFEGSPDGNWKMWSESGDLTSRGRFNRGTKVCKWETWSPTGEKSVEELPGADGGSCGKFVLETNRFSIFGVYLFQAPYAYLLSGGASWEPKFTYSTFPLYLRAGFSTFANRGASGSMFPALDAGLNLGFTLFQKLSIDFGPSYQIWMTGGSPASMTPNFRISYALQFWKFTQIWVGYAPANLVDGPTTNENKLGLTLSL